METIMEKKTFRNWGGKVCANVRRRNALKRLEAQYAVFKAAGKDKEPRLFKSGRSYADECARFSREIATLKSRLTI